MKGEVVGIQSILLWSYRKKNWRRLYLFYRHSTVQETVPFCSWRRYKLITRTPTLHEKKCDFVHVFPMQGCSGVHIDKFYWITLAHAPGVVNCEMYRVQNDQVLYSQVLCQSYRFIKAICRAFDIILGLLVVKVLRPENDLRVRRGVCLTTEQRSAHALTTWLLISS